MCTSIVIGLAVGDVIWIFLNRMVSSMVGATTEDS